MWEIEKGASQASGKKKKTMIMMKIMMMRSRKIMIDED